MNAPTRFPAPLHDQSRKEQAIRDVRARFHAQWLKLSADMQAEISRIEREDFR